MATAHAVGDLVAVRHRRRVVNGTVTDVGRILVAVELDDGVTVVHRYHFEVFDREEATCM